MRVRAVKINSSAYPDLLSRTKRPPKKLYYKGEWDTAIFQRCLAVVGSRQMTSYGRRVTEQLVSEIALAGVTIVSGFMYGIDAQAHQAALLAGGKTIAVMPCGIDLIHPAYQKSLYEAIMAKGGLILSELAGCFPPARWTYPERNRIIAGLAQATLVVEAGVKSGSLITAGFARKFGRKLFAVPGTLTSSVSQGCLQLIKEGAQMVTSAEDILAAYGSAKRKHPCGCLAYSGLNKLEESIVAQLAREPIEIDVLSRLIGVSAAELGAALISMQLRGVVREEGGKYYMEGQC